MLSKQIFKVGAWTATSRIFGFARDVLIARVLGAGRASDIFFAAFKLPNMFRDLLGEGALSAVFVPMFAKEKSNQSKAEQFASNIFSWLLLGLLVIVLVGVVLMPIIMMGVAPGFLSDPEKFNATVFFGRVLFFYLIFICGVGLLSGILNAYSEFAVAAAMPVLLNIFMIGGLLTAYYFKVAALPLLCLAVLLSGVAQMYILWRRIKKRNFGLRIIRPKWNSQSKTVFKRLGIGMLGSGFYQLNIVIGTLVASFQTGAISWLYYADRMVQLPFAIIGLAAGTVLLTHISDSISCDNIKSAHDAQNAAMRNSMMLTLPCMVGLFVLAVPIIRYLFEYGAWTPDATYAVAFAIMILCLALPAMTNSQIYSRTLFAACDVKTPVKFGAIALAVSTTLYLALAPFIGYLAIPIGTVVGGYLRNLLLYRECVKRGLFVMKKSTAHSIAAFFGLSVIMGAGLWLGTYMITSVFSLLVAIAIGGAFYLPLAHIINKKVLKHI